MLTDQVRNSSLLGFPAPWSWHAMLKCTGHLVSSLLTADNSHDLPTVSSRMDRIFIGVWCQADFGPSFKGANVPVLNSSTVRPSRNYRWFLQIFRYTGTTMTVILTKVSYILRRTSPEAAWWGEASNLYYTHMSFQIWGYFWLLHWESLEVLTHMDHEAKLDWLMLMREFNPHSLVDVTCKRHANALTKIL